MDNLALWQIVKREVADYADVIEPNAFVYSVANDDRQVYAVLAVPKEAPAEMSGRGAGSWRVRSYPLRQH